MTPLSETPSHPEAAFTTVVFKRVPADGQVSIIIPVFRDAPGLADTLSSLRRQSLPPARYEIIVANDGADPAVSRLCREYRVREVRITPNAGSYHARNRALEESRGEYLAFVDADVQVPETWLEFGCASLESADYVGGPVVIREASATTPARYHDMLTGFRAVKAENEYRFFVTANLFTTRRVIEDLGGFDERLRSGGDNEFGNRVFRSGKYVQRFVEELTVFHPPRDYRDLVRKRVRLHRGRRMLNQRYPDRYRYPRRPLLKHLWNFLLPPRVGAAREDYPPNPHFSFLRFYLFRWRYKAELALRLLPAHYAPLRLKPSAPAVTTVREPDATPAGGDGTARTAPGSTAPPVPSNPPR